jgi:uncharacterized protein (TIGR03435 family)
MLRTLLADRFRLLIHHETRELPTYNLIRLRREKIDKLRVSQTNCAALRAAATPPIPEQIRACMLAFGPGSLRGNGMTSAQFATAGLARIVDRPVIDKTGLGATLYDWLLEWTPEQGSRVAETDPNLPSSIFSAVQEQLGLKLDAATGRVDVLVIEHIERPTPD